MPVLILTIVVFVTVVLVVFAFGAAVVTPSSVLGARLRALGGQTVQTPEKPAAKVRERLEQALDPISKAIPLSPSDVSRTRAWLIQAAPCQLLLRRPPAISVSWPGRGCGFFRLPQRGLAGLHSRVRFLSSPLLPKAHD